MLVMVTVAVAHCCGVVGEKYQETAWETGRRNKQPVATASKFMKIIRKRAADGILSSSILYMARGCGAVLMSVEYNSAGRSGRAA